jgi:hypothetical protein
MTRFAHASLLTLALVFASACGSNEASVTAGAEAEMTASADLGAEALVEEHDEGSVAWRIDTDGQVKAAVTASTGARLKENLGGTLVYKVESGEPRTVPLVVDAKTGLLIAAGPKLEADLTEVSYTLTVSGKPWSGVMHVPVGGTTALVASAKATAEVKLPDETVGPHGGSIQVVGNERLEMVADADTGVTRVYVLDVNLKPVKVERRALRMGFVAKTTTFVNFDPEPSGFYFTARLGAAVLNPLRVTASLRVGGVTHAAIWGYRPGVRIYAPSAVVKIATVPRVRFTVVGGFDSGVDVYGRAHTKVHFRGDDDDDRKKGNNGRHVGQDGTWDRDSGGFKDDGRSDPRGGKAKSAGFDDRDHGGSKSSGSAKSSGGSSKSSGGSAKSSGGGSSKSSGGSSSKSSGGSSGGKGGKK